MELSGDKSIGFLPQNDEDDESSSPPRRTNRQDEPVRTAAAASGSSSHHSTYAGVNDGSEHYRDYPVSAAERQVIDNEAAATDAFRIDEQQNNRREANQWRLSILQRCWNAELGKRCWSNLVVKCVSIAYLPFLC